MEVSFRGCGELLLLNNFKFFLHMAKVIFLLFPTLYVDFWTLFNWLCSPLAPLAKNCWLSILGFGNSVSCLWVTCLALEALLPHLAVKLGAGWGLAASLSWRTWSCAALVSSQPALGARARMPTGETGNWQSAWPSSCRTLMITPRAIPESSNNGAC